MMTSHRSKAGSLRLATLVWLVFGLPLWALAPVGQQAPLDPQVHRVQQGETIERIARSHGMSVSSLVELNPWLLKATSLPPGSELRLMEPLVLDDQWPGVRALVTPDRGEPGTLLTLTVTGLPPSQEVMIGAGLKDSEATGFIHLNADAIGGLTKSFRIPADSAPGEEWVVLVSTPDWSVKALSNPVLVTSPSGDLIG